MTGVRRERIVLLVTTTPNQFTVRREARIDDCGDGSFRLYVSRAGRFVSSTIHSSYAAAEKAAGQKKATVVR